MNFRAFIIRHDEDHVENFTKVLSIDRDLFKGETWKRNDIVSVHVITHAAAAVCNSAPELEKFMKTPQLDKRVSDAPKKVEDRVKRDWEKSMKPFIEVDLEKSAAGARAAAEKAKGEYEAAQKNSDKAGAAFAKNLKDKAAAAATAAEEQAAKVAEQKKVAAIQKQRDAETAKAAEAGAGGGN